MKKCITIIALMIFFTGCNSNQQKSSETGTVTTNAEVIQKDTSVQSSSSGGIE